MEEIHIMIIKCPKCNKELNDYEISKLWCTNCNSKFGALSDLYDNNIELKEKKEKEEKLLSDFLITTGYQFDGYNIDKYFNLINSEVVLGTGIFSELDAKVSDMFGSISEKFEHKLNDAKKLAVQRIINSAIEINSNAIIGFKFEMFSLSNNILSVSAYGTAVRITKK